MLHESAIDKLIRPVIERQEEINLYVLQKVARHLKEIGSMTPSDAYKLGRLLRSGADAREINEYLSKTSQLQVREIQRIIDTVAQDNYKDAEPLYNLQKKPYIPYEENEPLRRVVRAIKEQTAGEYRNIMNAQAYMVRDPSDPTKLLPTPVSQAYDAVVDKAVQMASLGVEDYQTAIRDALQELIDSGMNYVTYNTESGRRFRQRTETAVRRNVLDGIREINQNVQYEIGRQFGANGIELSVHQFPAEDHAPVQGHQFTEKEFEKMQLGMPFTDIQGRTYKGFDRAIGTLNCRHFAFAIVLGTKPNYTDAQLADILRQNEEGYTMPNGKHLTMYQCTQEQRKLEHRIRVAKSGYMTAKAAGDEILQSRYAGQIDRYTREYNAFSRACGLKPKGAKLFVRGYKR